MYIYMEIKIVQDSTNAFWSDPDFCSFQSQIYHSSREDKKVLLWVMYVIVLRTWLYTKYLSLYWTTSIVTYFRDICY